MWVEVLENDDVEHEYPSLSAPDQAQIAVQARFRKSKDIIARNNRILERMRDWATIPEASTL